MDGQTARMGLVQIGWALAAVLVALAVSAAMVTRLGRLGSTRRPVIAAIRAVVQLAAVSAVIGVVLSSMVWTGLFLLVMVAVAAGTSARRIAGALHPAGWWTMAAITAGVAPTMGMIVASTWSRGSRPRCCRRRES